MVSTLATVVSIFQLGTDLESSNCRLHLLVMQHASLACAGTVDGHAQAAASALQCGSVVTEFLVVDHDDGESAAEYGSSQVLT
eukprot:6488962-Amphidinium_carterae.1